MPNTDTLYDLSIDGQIEEQRILGIIAEIREMSGDARVALREDGSCEREWGWDFGKELRPISAKYSTLLFTVEVTHDDGLEVYYFKNGEMQQADVSVVVTPFIPPSDHAVKLEIEIPDGHVCRIEDSSKVLATGTFNEMMLLWALEFNPFDEVAHEFRRDFTEEELVQRKADSPLNGWTGTLRFCEDHYRAAREGKAFDEALLSRLEKDAQRILDALKRDEYPNPTLHNFMEYIAVHYLDSDVWLKGTSEDHAATYLDFSVGNDSKQYRLYYLEEDSEVVEVGTSRIKR